MNIKKDPRCAVRWRISPKLIVAKAARDIPGIIYFERTFWGYTESSLYLSFFQKRLSRGFVKLVHLCVEHFSGVCFVAKHTAVPPFSKATRLDRFRGNKDDALNQH